jgi:hypothetical protein
MPKEEAVFLSSFGDLIGIAQATPLGPAYRYLVRFPVLVYG